MERGRPLAAARGHGSRLRSSAGTAGPAPTRRKPRPREVGSISALGEPTLHITRLMGVGVLAGSSGSLGLHCHGDFGQGVSTVSVGEVGGQGRERCQTDRSRRSPGDGPGSSRVPVSCSRCASDGCHGPPLGNF